VQQVVGPKLDIVHHRALPKGGQATRAGTTRNYVGGVNLRDVIVGEFCRQRFISKEILHVSGHCNWADCFAIYLRSEMNFPWWMCTFVLNLKLRGTNVTIMSDGLPDRRRETYELQIIIGGPVFSWRGGAHTLLNNRAIAPTVIVADRFNQSLELRGVALEATRGELSRALLEDRNHFSLSEVLPFLVEVPCVRSKERAHHRSQVYLAHFLVLANAELTIEDVSFGTLPLEGFVFYRTPWRNCRRRSLLRGSLLRRRVLRESVQPGSKLRGRAGGGNVLLALFRTVAGHDPGVAMAMWDGGGGYDYSTMWVVRLVCGARNFVSYQGRMKVCRWDDGQGGKMQNRW
jgi:hypothetical protein